LGTHQGIVNPARSFGRALMRGRREYHILLKEAESPATDQASGDNEAASD